MCPISGSVQFLFLAIVVLLIIQYAVAQTSWNISYKPLDDPITMHSYEEVNFNLTGPRIDQEHCLSIYSENTHIADANATICLRTDNFSSGFYSGKFNITGNFLGQTRVFFKLKNENTQTSVLEDSMDVVVIRETRVIDTVFTVSVIIFVSIIYINFGCAMNWQEFRKTLKRPIGPALGFVSQFAFMPVMSYLLGILLFPDYPEMQLGMFFTGVSPGGGASNIWTLVLEGNIDLSIAMTTISTFAAFGMMPLWIFTLGRVVFEKAKLTVPYERISEYAFALVVPLLIGYLLQRFAKKVARFLTRILKIFGVLLLLFIVVFATVTNLYLFELFSWQIVIAGLGLPWLGYVFGYLLSWAFKQPAPNRLAIAIETGIQNTGIAIFLLRFALPQPQADLTTVAPVCVAVMTPFPLILLYIYKKIVGRYSKKHKELDLPEELRFSDVDLETESSATAIPKKAEP